MKKLFCCMLFILCSTKILSEVPNEFQYTGFLREFGKPVTDKRGIIFNIYTQPTGGTPVWSSGEVMVDVSSGVFSCVLSPNIDLRDGNYWIETVISGKIFSPRQKIMPQVFALHSNTAEHLSNKSDIHFVVLNTTCAVLTQSGDLELLGNIISQSVTTESIKDGAITTSKLADSSVTDAKIVSVSASKITGQLSNNVVVSSIAVNSVHTAAIQNNAVTDDKVASIDASKITSGVLPVSRGGTGVGSGIPNYLLKWDNSSVANSIIYDDGSKVGVGTTGLGISRMTIRGVSSDTTAGCLHLVNSSNLTILYARNDRNVSIGDNDPGPARLKIVSENNSYGLIIQNSSGSIILSVKGDRRVGILTDSPNGPLDVRGKIKEYGYDLLPRGVIVMWSGSIASIPSGWALCDGGTYIAPDGTPVTTPDLRDRFIVGAGGSYFVGATGGTNYVILNVTQIPSHTHLIDPPPTNTTINGAHSHYLRKATTTGDVNASELGTWWGDWSYEELTSETGAHSHTVDIPAFYSSPFGGGQPHENRPPYYALAFIMKL